MTGNRESSVKEYGDGVAWIRGPMIGKGSYGSVYLATLKNPASKYSCLPPVIAVKSAEVSISSSIQKEMEVFTNLKGCPNVIECYGEETTVGNNGVMAYNLLLEYGAGGTLADRIKKSGGGLPESEAKVYARSILRGLKHIHSLRYVHCDLKPDNVLLVKKIGRGFRAKIGDFGLTKREIDSKSKKRKLKDYCKGTPMYLSPEALIENVQEKSCDIWAFGCVLVEMLTGKALWEGDTEGILRKIGVGRECVENEIAISKEAKGFLKGCFVKNPKFRWSAEMLLCHEFLEGVDDGDQEKARFALNDIGSISSVDESSDEDEDEDEDEDDEGEKGNCGDESIEMLELEQSLLKRRKYDDDDDDDDDDPFSFEIHVGM